MNAERYALVQAIFEDARRLPPGERETLLRERCDGDSGLRRDVETLIAALDDEAVTGGPSLLAHQSGGRRRS